jgi:serine/threonine protein kinase
MEEGSQGLVDGRYRVVRKLGHGAFGRVDLCTDEATGAPVAVKRLHPIRSGEEVARRFLREGRAAARVRHPGVVAVLAAGEEPGGDLYLVSEYVEGVELARLLEREGARSPEEARLWLEKLAEALAAIHEAGVLHRDLKPSNMLVAHGEPRICDFGMARIEDGRTVITSTGQVVGTPRYLAPEHMRQANASTPAGDVWALGAVGYELATGAKWLQPEDLLRLAATPVETPDPPGYQERLAKVPDPELRAVLARLLTDDPGARPPDGAGVVALLAAPPAPPRPRPPAEPSRSPVPPVRRRLPPLLLPVAALCLGVALRLATTRQPEAPTPDPLSVQATVPPARPPGPDHDAQLREALATLRLDDEDLVDRRLRGEPEMVAFLEAFAAPVEARRWQGMLEALVQAARADPTPEEFGPTTRAIAEVIDRFHRLDVHFDDRAIQRLLTHKFERGQAEAWAELRDELGHAAGDALGRLNDGETLRRSPDHALLALLLMSMDPAVERARILAADLVPYAARELPRAPPEVAPDLSNELERVFRDAETTRRVHFPVSAALLGELAPALREPGRRWPVKVRQQVLKDQLTAAAFLLRRTREAPPQHLVEAFDELLEQLEEACAGNPERLVDRLNSVQDHLEWEDILAGPPGPEFLARQARVRDLRGE